VRADLERVKILAESWKPEQVLSWAFATYGDDVAVATGLGVEGMALLDIASRVNPDLKVFTGDTEFLFSETYDLMDRVEERYGIKIERLYSELTPEDQERLYGKALWARDPDECCSLRKVEPLRRKLATLDAWVTGVRRDQTSERQSIRKVDWDYKFNLVKISPLADWTARDVYQYMQAHQIPELSLYNLGYTSIGCKPCTALPLDPNDPRSGRWAGQKVECGIHIPAAPSAN